ncbi:endonuclease [Spirochaetia bacterium]|nr:endonuclease [Spirochaetia bacterium]
MNFLKLLCAAFVLPLFTSCFSGCDVYEGASGGARRGELSIATWNVQALFDGGDDGGEYDEYTPKNGWNKEKFEARCEVIGKAVSQIEGGGSDILALIEVEKREVLQELAEGTLKNQRYNYGFFAANAGFSLGIGILSRYPFTKTYSHSANINGDRIPRPIAEVWLEPDGTPLVIFVCHWKSKLGGEDETEFIRRNAARVILRRVKAIYNENPDIPVLVLGDLNENVDEFYRSGSEKVCALLPDDPAAAIKAGFALANTDTSDDDMLDENSLPQQDFLIISGEKPPVSSFFAKAEGVFYSPWGTEMQNGSYYYGSEWETIDHLLLSRGFFDKRGWEFKTAHVVDTEPFVNSKGEPNIYNPRSGSGVSDHLPLLLVLTHLF